MGPRFHAMLQRKKVLVLHTFVHIDKIFITVSIHIS